MNRPGQTWLPAGPCRPAGSAEAPPAARRRGAWLIAVSALLLACVCPVALPGSRPAPTPPEAEATAPPGAATFAPGAQTALPAAPEEATPGLSPTAIPRTVIPPTAAVGAEFHEVIAGEIAQPGQEQVTVFSAVPGQEFFFGVVQRDNDLTLTRWRATDAAGQEIFNACLGCGNPGVFTLERGGEYTIVVGEPDSGVGQYQIVVASVRVHHFAVTPGAPIAFGQPGPGAGSLETPGARDMYTFSAAAGEEVFFGVPAYNGVPLSSFVLLDEAAVIVFQSCVGCGHPGATVLERGGLYTLIVGGDNDLATGTYELAVAPVRTDSFAVVLGETIADGFPGPGAGNIETPGARDVYTFTAEPGQQVSFAAPDHQGIALVHWVLTDESGAALFDTCLGCSAPGILALERGGAYTLTVGGGREIAVGSYELEVRQP